jgi:hypothetical protein
MENRLVSIFNEDCANKAIRYGSVKGFIEQINKENAMIIAEEEILPMIKKVSSDYIVKGSDYQIKENYLTRLYRFANAYAFYNDCKWDESVFEYLISSFNEMFKTEEYIKTYKVSRKILKSLRC